MFWSCGLCPRRTRRASILVSPAPHFDAISPAPLPPQMGYVTDRISADAVLGSPSDEAARPFRIAAFVQRLGFVLACATLYAVALLLAGLCPHVAYLGDADSPAGTWGTYAADRAVLTILVGMATNVPALFVDAFVGWKSFGFVAICFGLSFSSTTMLIVYLTGASPALHIHYLLSFALVAMGLFHAPSLAAVRAAAVASRIFGHRESSVGTSMNCGAVPIGPLK